MHKALVISPNERTSELGSLLAIARSEAFRREHTPVNPPVKVLVFVPEVGMYVVIYQVIDQLENGKPKNNIKSNREVGGNGWTYTTKQHIWQQSRNRR